MSSPDDDPRLTFTHTLLDPKDAKQCFARPLRRCEAKGVHKFKVGWGFVEYICNDHVAEEWKVTQ